MSKRLKVILAAWLIMIVVALVIYLSAAEGWRQQREMFSDPTGLEAQASLTLTAQDDE